MTDQDLAAFDRESERRQRAADFAASHPEWMRPLCAECAAALEPAPTGDGAALCLACCQEPA